MAYNVAGQRIPFYVYGRADFDGTKCAYAVYAGGNITSHQCRYKSVRTKVRRHWFCTKHSDIAKRQMK